LSIFHVFYKLCENQTEILEIKSPFSQTENTVEGHSSRLQQEEDRISEQEDTLEIKDKIEELLIKQPKGCDRYICKNSANPSKDQT
jgi:hypothetical protein